MTNRKMPTRISSMLSPTNAVVCCVTSFRCSLLHYIFCFFVVVVVRVCSVTLAQKQTAWNRFMNSVRARLNVAQIVHAVKQDATITFDFIMLLTIAGLLAAFGLVENSTVFLASSMLISPLMVRYWHIQVAIL